MFPFQERRDSAHSRVSGGSMPGSPLRLALNMHPQQQQPTMMSSPSQTQAFPVQNGRQLSPEDLANPQRREYAFMRWFAQASPEKRLQAQQQMERQRQAARTMAASPMQAQAQTNGMSGLEYTPERALQVNIRNATMAQMSPGQVQQQQQPRAATSASLPDVYFTANNGKQYTCEELEQRLARTSPQQQAEYRKMAERQQHLAQQSPLRPATAAAPANVYYINPQGKRYTRESFEEGLKTVRPENQARIRGMAEAQQQRRLQQQPQPATAASPADTYSTNGKGNMYTRDFFEQHLASMPPKEVEHFRQVVQLRQQQSRVAAGPAQAQNQHPQRHILMASTVDVYNIDSNGRAYPEAQLEQHLAMLTPEQAEQYRQQVRQKRQTSVAPSPARAQAQAQQQPQHIPAESPAQLYLVSGKGQRLTRAQFDQLAANMPPEQVAKAHELAGHQRQARMIAFSQQTTIPEQMQNYLQMATRLAQMGPEERAKILQQMQQQRVKQRAPNSQATSMPSTMASQAQAAAKASMVTQGGSDLPQIAGIKRPSPDTEGAYTEGRTPKVAMLAVPTPPARPSSTQGGVVAKQKKKKAKVKDIKRRPKKQGVPMMNSPAKSASAMSPPAVPASAMSSPAIPASAMRQTKTQTSGPMRQIMVNTSETIDLTGTENISQPINLTRSQESQIINSPGLHKSSAIDLTSPEDPRYIKEQPPTSGSPRSAALIANNARELEKAGIKEIGAPTTSELGVHRLHLHALQNGVFMRDCEYGDFIYDDIRDYSSEAAEINMRRAMLEDGVEGTARVSTYSSYMYDARHKRDLVGYDMALSQVEVVQNGKEQMSEEGAELAWQMMNQS
jgi:hypothetical protein